MLWICEGCTCRYSVGAPGCPQCGSTDYVEEGADMPKITVHGGPSNAAAEPDPAAEADTVETAAVETAETGPEETPADTPDYEALKVGQLREELARRGLDTDGVKAELVERLTASDSAE